MSDSEDKSSKTEDASERKIQKAREQGDTWSTKEPGHMMAYLGVLAVIAIVLPATVAGSVGTFAKLFDLAGFVRIENPQDLHQALGTFVEGTAAVLLPALMVMVVASICAIVLSGPLVVSLKRIEPKFSKLNPLAGLKRLVSVNNLVEFTKSLLKLALIGSLMLWVFKQTIDKMLPGALVLPEAVLGIASEAAQGGLAWVLAIMIPIVIFDVFWKRHQWLKKQMMTKKEQKDEMKDSEGSPEIRQRRMQIGRNRIRQQMRKSVPSATLVVMNPTHYAVALRYERGVDAAPVCVAKGKDAFALAIRDLALEHEVPVLEAPPLARALHAASEVDKVIPEEHWPVVAELVGYVLDLRLRIKRKLPSGAYHVNR